MLQETPQTCLIIFLDVGFNSNRCQAAHKPIELWLTAANIGRLKIKINSLSSFKNMGYVEENRAEALLTSPVVDEIAEKKSRKRTSSASSDSDDLFGDLKRILHDPDAVK